MPRQDLFLQALKLLSQRASQIEPSFNVSACLHPEERELIGYIRAYPKIFGETQFTKWLNDKVIPGLQEIGRSRWPRTELTDLGFVISNKDEEEVTLVSDVEEEVRL